MSEGNRDWVTYYDRVKGRPARQLLLDAVDRFPAGQERLAAELGFGDGTEVAVLLELGWRVLAIDSEAVAIQRLVETTSEAHKARLRTEVMAFEMLALPVVQLIHASYSLPFCSPGKFPEMWGTISSALDQGGRFAGQFFGIHDSWADQPDMTFHTEAQVRAMLAGFDVEYFQEQDEDGQASTGPKHWHVFTVIARKR